MGSCYVASILAPASNAFGYSLPNLAIFQHGVWFLGCNSPPWITIWVPLGGWCFGWVFIEPLLQLFAAWPVGAHSRNLWFLPGEQQQQNKNNRQWVTHVQHANRN
jgi:hypothetical protein